MRVIPHGELDLSTAGQFDARIRELVTARWSCVVVDLGGLSFIDSTGLNLLIRWAHAARADGWALEVLPGGGAVHRVFERAGVIDSLPFAFDGDGPLRPHP